MYERFFELLNERGLRVSDVAKATGIHPSTFTDWKTGKSSPKYDKIVKIADYFNVSSKWLTGESDIKSNQEIFQHFDNVTDLAAIQEQIKEAKIGTVQIPVLGEVAAGIPIFAQENYIDYEYISEQQAINGNYFGLKIKGDSMSPRISEGDTVIVRQQEDAESGDIVIVLINGDSATCKRLMKYAEGISLISFNPLYEPMTFSNEDILSKPVKIIGKVVENRQKY